MNSAVEVGVKLVAASMVGLLVTLLGKQFQLIRPVIELLLEPQGMTLDM